MAHLFFSETWTKCCAVGHTGLFSESSEHLLPHGTECHLLVPSWLQDIHRVYTLLCMKPKVIIQCEKNQYTNVNTFTVIV